MAERTIWTGVTAFSKVAEIEHDGRPGTSADDTGQGHVPWTGAVPLVPLKTEGLGVFVRRADGVWRRRDTRTRLYPVNEYGERIAKPKTFIEGGSAAPDQARLAALSSISGGRYSMLLRERSGGLRIAGSQPRLVSPGGRRCQQCGGSHQTYRRRT